MRDKIKQIKYLLKNIRKIKLPAILIFVFLIITALFLFLKEGVIKKIQADARPKYIIYEHIINPGETFSVIAANLELTPDQASEILTVSDKVHSLADIKAGQTIKTFFDPKTEQFQKLEYQLDQDNLLVLELEGGELKAKNQAIAYEIKPTKVSGTIENSLYQTAQNLGMTDKTIIEMADIFAWDIDFGFDVQPGDKFELIYEKRFLDDKEFSPGKILIARYQSQEKTYWAVYYKDAGNRIDYYDLDGNCSRRQFLRAPLQYKYISSGFTYQRLHPILGRYTQHTAIDYAAPSGTPVSATGGGTVTFVGGYDEVGKTVMIRHNATYSTRFSHLSAYAQGMKKGTSVSQGQIIGYVGSTGALSTGPHLEYAMTKYGKSINPLNENFEKVEPLNSLYQEDFNLLKEKLLKEINS